MIRNSNTFTYSIIGLFRLIASFIKGREKHPESKVILILPKQKFDSYLKRQKLSKKFILKKGQGKTEQPHTTELTALISKLEGMIDSIRGA